MNLNTLERLVRQAVNGDNVAEESNTMLRAGFISPAEHRSLSSLSNQIAANMRINGNGTAVMAAPAGLRDIYAIWLNNDAPDQTMVRNRIYAAWC